MSLILDIIDVKTDHEYCRVFSLFRDVVSASPYYSDANKVHELTKFNPLNNPQDHHIVTAAKIDDATVGFTIAIRDQGLLWLSWIGIDFSYRKRGIATALLEQLDMTALSIGSHKIWCDSRTENAGAEAMFISHGYRKICIMTNHWFNQDFFLWERPLPRLV